MVDGGDDRKALALLAAMVGTVVLRRASDDEVLADAIENAVVRFAETPWPAT